MDNYSPFIYDLTVTLCVAGVIALLFQRLRQPAILGYLIAGIIIGPYALPHSLVNDAENINILSELGVMFLMFSLGLEFNFSKLKEVGPTSGVIALIEIGIMLSIGTAIGFFMYEGYIGSLFFAVAVCNSSAIITTKLIQDCGLLRFSFSSIVLSVLVMEDLITIILLIMLTTLVTTSHIVSLEIFEIILHLILVVGSWFLIGYLFVPSLLQKLQLYISEETLTIAAIALCLLLVSIAAYFDYPTSLGAFIMGAILAETAFINRIKKLIAPLRDVFVAIFFVSVGMLVDPKIMVDQLPQIIGICAFIIIGKALSVSFACFITGQKFDDSLKIGFSLAQIGEFSYIVAALGIGFHVLDTKIYPILVAVSLITAFTSPLLIKFPDKLIPFLNKHLSYKVRLFLKAYPMWVRQAPASFASLKDSPKPHQALVRFLINGIVVAIIFNAIKFLSLHKLYDFFHSIVFAEEFTWLMATILSSPFIYGMLTAFSTITKTKESPLRRIITSQHIAWLFVAIEILVLSIVYIRSWLISGLLLLSIIIFFAVLYKKIGALYKMFEQRLLSNLNEEQLPEDIESLSEHNLHLVGVQIEPNSELAGKTIQPELISNEYGINILALVRENHIETLTANEQYISSLDKLLVLGDDAKINNFVKAFHMKRLSKMVI